MMENKNKKKHKSRKNIFQKNSCSKLGSNSKTLINYCAKRLSFTYSIYFIFYAWCVYSLLSNQFFVIPICLVTFFFPFFLFFFILLTPQKNTKLFLLDSQFIWLLSSSSHTSNSILDVRFFNPKNSSCSVIMFRGYILMWIFYFSCTDHNFNIFTTF